MRCATCACERVTMIGVRLIVTAFIVACVTSAAHARPCDAVQKASGDFTAGKLFDGEVVQVLDARTIRITPVGQAANAQSACDVDLRMFSSGDQSGPAELTQSRRFLDEFVLHQEVACMPQPSKRTLAGGEARISIWDGDRVSASCDINYPLGSLLRKVREVQR